MNTFRTLLAVMLLLNGLATPQAVALRAATGMASHAGHVPDSAPAALSPDASHAQHPADTAEADCCDTTDCDCGCAAPHATTLPASLPRTSWRAVLAEFTFMVKTFHSGPRPAPFRPPA